MILSTLSESGRIESLHPLFKSLFDYVKSHDLSAVPAGRIVIQGDDLFINVADNVLIDREAQKLEVHRAYIDVHIPLNGSETIGWRPLADMPCPPDAPFDVTNDFALYAAPATAYVDVLPGQFLAVWPEDAHAPLIGTGRLRKLIAKVRL